MFRIGEHAPAADGWKYRTLEIAKLRHDEQILPWSFQRENTSLGRFVKEDATAVEYLKTLAISRIYLENIFNIRSEDLPGGPAVRRERRGQHHD